MSVILAKDFMDFANSFSFKGFLICKVIRSLNKGFLDLYFSNLFAIILFLFVGCEESTKVKDSDSSSKKNTLNNPDLDPDPGRIEDYFYNFDEGVEAQYLYYNSYITRGTNTITGLNPYLDILSFRTFPYYTVVDINGKLEIGAQRDGYHDYILNDGKMYKGIFQLIIVPIFRRFKKTLLCMDHF